jgi:hypothetical protein
LIQSRENVTTFALTERLEVEPSANEHARRHRQGQQQRDGGKHVEQLAPHGCNVPSDDSGTESGSLSADSVFDSQ